MRKVKLSHLCKVSNGFAFKSDDYVSHGYRVMRITNVQKGLVLDSDPKFISDEIAHKASNFKLNVDDILISLTGNVGRVGKVQAEHLPAILNQRVGLIRPISPEIDLQYLFQFLNSDTFEREAIQNSNGVAQLNLSSKWIENYAIPLPSLNDQIRIAHLLGKVEALIAQRKQHLQLLDDLLKSVFLEMFGDPVRAEHGRVLTTIGDSVEIQSGQVDPRELPYSEMLHVGGANIEPETGNFLNLQQAKYENLISGKYLFDSSYILYSKIRPYLNKVSKPAFQGICSADIYPIRPVAGLLNRDFLRLLLMSKGFLNYTANNSDRANIPKINRKALIAFSFYRPSIEAQHQFSIVVEKVEGLRLQSQQSLMDLEALYGALSQQAFNGQLVL